MVDNGGILNISNDMMYLFQYNIVHTGSIHSVPHLKAADGAGFVLVVLPEDELQSDETVRIGRFKELKVGIGPASYLPLFDFIPQVFEFLQIQLPGAISLQRGWLRPKLFSKYGCINFTVLIVQLATAQ